MWEEREVGGGGERASVVFFPVADLCSPCTLRAGTERSTDGRATLPLWGTRLERLLDILSCFWHGLFVQALRAAGCGPLYRH